MGDTLGKLPLALYASDANWGHRGLSSLLNTLAQDDMVICLRMMDWASFGVW